MLQRYYDCTIQEVTANGYKVVFPTYGNVEEVPLEYLQKKVTLSQAKVRRFLPWVLYTRQVSFFCW